MEIIALDNAHHDPVYVDFQGLSHVAGQNDMPPDTLPDPEDFAQRVIRNCFGPSAAGSSPAQFDCLRPQRGQILALGRLNGGPAAANTAQFVRGIITVGGIGANPIEISGKGGPGGIGGSIILHNDTSGSFSFDNVDFFTGAGAEGLCYYVYETYRQEDWYYWEPSGGLGGQGNSPGGAVDGGELRERFS